MSRKKDGSDLTLFIPFLLVHDYLFYDQTSLEYICKGFQVFFCHILGVKITDLVSLNSYTYDTPRLQTALSILVVSSVTSLDLDKITNKV